MKTRFSLVLAMIMVVLSCVGCWSVLAEASDSSGIQLVMDNLILQEDTKIVLPEGKLQAELYLEARNDLVTITYIWDEGSSEENQQYLTGNLPEQIDFDEEFIIGTEHTLRCVAVYKDGKLIDKTFCFKAVTQHKNMEQLDFNVMLNGIPMYQEREYFIDSNDVISVESESFLKDSPVKLAGYYWAEADTWERITETVNFFDEESTSFEIEIPEEYIGTQKVLMVEAVLTNNQGADDASHRTGWQAFFFYISDDVNEYVANGTPANNSRPLSAPVVSDSTANGTPANNSRPLTAPVAGDSTTNGTPANNSRPLTAPVAGDSTTNGTPKNNARPFSAPVANGSNA